MKISKQKQELISYQVIKILISRFDSFPENASGNRNAPFHEAFLNAFTHKLLGKVADIPFLISLSSWLHGLNTTLGQTFFEAVAHILSDSGKREFTSKREGVLKISKSQNDTINDIITDLSNDKEKPDLIRENTSIFKKDVSSMVNAIDFSADVFIEENDNIIAIELKSVKPNSGEMRGEKDKILQGKAALYHKYQGKDIQFFIGFPFDPTESVKPEGYDKTRFTASIINMDKYFAHDEVLLAEELWNFLSGHEDTMSNLLTIINNIATVDFLDNFNYVCDSANRNEQKYSDILFKWGIYSELELAKSDTLIKEQVSKNKKLQRVYNKQLFNGKGEYSLDRYNSLKGLLKN